MNTFANLSVKQVIDASPSYVMLVDSNHHIVEANAAVYKSLKVKRKDILGKYCPQIIHGLNGPFPGCPLEESALKNRPVQREVFDKKSGRWLLSSIYPIKQQAGDGTRVFLHTVVDITENKLSQDQLKDSHRIMQSLTQRIQSVREEEKRRIAKDLHDGTSQIITSLQTYLHIVRDTLPPGSAKAKRFLRKAQELAATIQEDIHQLVYELYPPILGELGLVPAIHSLVKNQLQPGGTRVRFSTSGKIIRLPTDIEIHVFRIIQEIFNNIIQHSKANNVFVKVRFRTDDLTVCVNDNGVGFDVNKEMTPDYDSWGIGLLSMKERVNLLNGSLVIKSNPGQGTEVTLQIPRLNEKNI